MSCSVSRIVYGDEDEDDAEAVEGMLAQGYSAGLEEAARHGKHASSKKAPMIVVTPAEFDSEEKGVSSSISTWIEEDSNGCNSIEEEEVADALCLLPLASQPEHTPGRSLQSNPVLSRDLRGIKSTFSWAKHQRTLPRHARTYAYWMYAYLAFLIVFNAITAVVLRVLDALLYLRPVLLSEARLLGVTAEERAQRALDLLDMALDLKWVHHGLLAAALLWARWRSVL